ncbi:ABC transporter permease [Nonomuraea africana]|uniref:Peptide/nickel transport system permease protein n=1 Tax=Nonomuraea africana TaxID=46171 RepID=A0ABR9KAC0_9ACTN|nr:ABC transporter permease [Nonomuraea africana]MBE1558965.1 peptide/nickel transport system permease protein [Nonomuraea africana]
MRNGKVRAGVAVFAFFVLAALVGPFVTDAMGLSPTAIDAAASLQPPSAAHPLGTTMAGEDVLAQLVVGARTSLLVGLVAGTIATTLSVLAGVTGAYLGGKADALLTAFTNVFLVLPGLPLLIIIASYVQGRGGWLLVALIIGLTGWPWGARQKRAQTLTLRRRDFVMAAELAGESRWRIIVFDLIPNLAPLISTSLLGAVVASVFADAGLAFIGVGNINITSWGSMLYWSQQQQALLQGAWWWFVPPGACIALLGTAAGLINFGVDEISNPRLRAATRSVRRRVRKAAMAGE